MSKSNEAWGIEVGAQAIKLMKLSRSGSGVALENFEVLPFKHVLTTPDLNAEEAIRVHLEALSAKHDFDKSTVVVSVPGHMAFARFAKLPPIEASKVKSIVAYEAQQQIPFPIDEVEWDYQVFAQEDAPDIEVGIFAITKERVAHFLSNYRSVGLDVDTLTLSPVAVYNAFAYDTSAEGEAANSVYLDIGTVSTDIIVVESGGIWLRTLPLGGNHFTQALMKQFKISFAKAEKLKLEASTSKYAKQIFQAMRGVFSDLVSEIQRSLGFYQSLNRDAELTRIVGVGSTWKLPGLQKYLQQNLQMEVGRPDGFSRLEVDGRRAAEFSSVAVNMATAYGLALQGLGLSAVDANILPQTILRQRMWKAKQPWFGAAAACVAAAPFIAGVTLLMKNSSFDTAWSQNVQNEINSTITVGQTKIDEYNNKVVANDPRPGIRNYRRSFDYVNLYPKLYQDISTAMATIEPNEKLSAVDWNNLEDIKRFQEEVDRPARRQVWVTRVTTQYKMPKAAATDATTGFTGSDSGFDPTLDDPTGEFGGAFPDDGFGAGGFDGGSSESVAGLTPVPFPPMPEPPIDDTFGEPPADDTFDEDGGEVDPDAAPSEESNQPVKLSELDLKAFPRIIVTVRGRTTLDEPTISALLEDQFGGWLEANAEREDRPYIYNPKFTYTSYESIAEIGERTDFGAGTGFDGGVGIDNASIRPTPFPKQPQGTSPLGPGLGGPTGEFGGPTGPGFGGPGGLLNPDPVVREEVQVQTPEGWYTKLGASSGGFSVDALLPRRPLSNENNLQDTRFTFSFEVILLPPDQARKTVLPPEDQPDQTPGDDTEPTAAGNLQQEQQS